jgi:hypothetical protein
MHDLSIPTWIMHGSLLGWWWNRRIMPWDSDLDVQISEKSIQFLADYYNMTIHTFKLPGKSGKKENRNYMLEINPHFRNTSLSDTLNAIDARWIDTETGLFIDITVVHPNRTTPGNLFCKDGHQFREDDVFPLRDDVFEGMPVKIPYAYSQLLEEEYGPEALTDTDYHGYEFRQKNMQWVLVNVQPCVIPAVYRKTFANHCVEMKMKSELTNHTQHTHSFESKPRKKRTSKRRTRHRARRHGR